MVKMHLLTRLDQCQKILCTPICDGVVQDDQARKMSLVPVELLDELKELLEE